VWRGRPRPRITRFQASTLWLKWPAAPLFRLLEAALSERNTPPDTNSLRRIRQLPAPDGAWKPSHRPAADILSAAPETPGSPCSERKGRNVLRLSFAHSSTIRLILYSFAPIP